MKKTQYEKYAKIWDNQRNEMYMNDSLLNTAEKNAIWANGKDEK